VDFGANGEGYVRFCFARDRAELTGALESMRTVFATEEHGRTRITSPGR
jgi:bifunctional pyridoxal-dependent enzyme with beta-cystathionase and maltose regulon repressor activities